MTEGGYAKAWRRRWDHQIFRNLQEAAVWAWMTDKARFTPHRFMTKFGMVELGFGQLLISERSLAASFGLHRNTLRNLLARMVDEDMITLNRDHSANKAGTIVTVVNFHKWQILSDEKDDAQDQSGTENGTMAGPVRDQSGTSQGPQEKKGEEGKEGKKGEEGASRRYVFEGRLVRVTEKHFQEWQEAYHSIPDLKAELAALDSYYDRTLSGTDRKDWFHKVSGALNRQHQKNMAQMAEQNSPSLDIYKGVI